MQIRFDFSVAIRCLKQGARVAREGWNGKGMFIFLVPGSQFHVNRPPLLGIYPGEPLIDYRGHIDMKTADGSLVPWVASQTDLLAEDWVTVGESEGAMIVRCPICTKDAPAGSVHTCTPTEAWRQATAQMDHYRKALEAIVKHQEAISPTGFRLSVTWNIATRALES